MNTHTLPSEHWFRNAKLGIFIHWGLYSVNGIAESWSFFNGEISYDDYLKQCDGFTAASYRPEDWADLFHEAGARYAILTSKHHDGFALWDTSFSSLKVTERTPAARDLVAPFCEALRQRDLNVGLYFSHLDWSHPDYASVFNEKDTDHVACRKYDRYGFAFPASDAEVDEVAWARFLAFHRNQLEELMNRFDPDLLWFDGDWERSGRQWQMKELRDLLKKHKPEVLLNSRMHGYGDYETPEQSLPIEPPQGPWEFCMTLNDSWGYQSDDSNHKPLWQLIRTFTEVIGMGGNLLLGVGPRADGTFIPEQATRLRELGAWISKHHEAVYETQAGMPFAHYNGANTLSHDRRILYLFVHDIPRHGIFIKGIRNPVKAVSLVGTGHALSSRVQGGAPWAGLPGTIVVELSADLMDSECSVVKIEFEEPLELYRGSGESITQN